MGKKIQFIKYILFMIFFAAVCMKPYNINAAETTDIKASPAPTMRPEHYEEVAVTTEQQYMPEEFSGRVYYEWDGIKGTDEGHKEK